MKNLRIILKLYLKACWIKVNLHMYCCVVTDAVQKSRDGKEHKGFLMAENAQHHAASLELGRQQRRQTTCRKRKFHKIRANIISNEHDKHS